MFSTKRTDHMSVLHCVFFTMMSPKTSHRMTAQASNTPLVDAFASTAATWDKLNERNVKRNRMEKEN